MNKYLILLIILAASFCALYAAAGDDRLADQETVTFLETTNFNDAVQILETFSWKYERKKLINMSNVNDAIGIPIHNLTWRRALEMMLLKKGLTYDESVGAVMIRERTISTAASTSAAPAAGVPLINAMQEMIDTKQVRISAVAFTCDKAYLRSLGINWSTLLDGRVDAEINFNGATEVPGNIFNASASTGWDLDNGYRLDVNTLLNAIESNELGNVIARPSILVSSGKEGHIQVGQDISVKSVDDAGNTVEQFFETGVIMTVTPTILTSHDSIEVIHLTTKVERSSATPGTVSTVINKSTATTDIILYDGEETAIGGLYDTDETRVRSGIPFLKDLPWWVLGIRYLAGYDKLEKKERELVIILKAEIIEDALTRLKNKTD